MVSSWFSFAGGNDSAKKRVRRMNRQQNRRMFLESLEDRKLMAVSAFDLAPATLNVNEDAAATLIGSFTVSDGEGANTGNEESDISVALSATNGTLSVTSITLDTETSVSAQLSAITYTPNSNYNGADTIQVVMDDGEGPVTHNVAVTVNAVNDTPTFTAPASATAVLEDAGAVTQVGFISPISAGAANESGQALTFTVTGNNNPGLFSALPSIAANGDLSFTPAANANGQAIITVNLRDDATAGGAAIITADQTFTINVTAVNDQPSYTVNGSATGVSLISADNYNVTVNEDAGSVASFAQNISDGPPNESGQAVIFSVSEAADPDGIFTGAFIDDVTGNLSFSINADRYSETGKGVFVIKLNDTGSNSAPNDNEAATTTTITVQVDAVNDNPFFDDFVTTVPKSMPSGAIIDTVAPAIDDAYNEDDSSLVDAKNITYSLVGGVGNATSVFDFNPLTRELTVKNSALMTVGTTYTLTLRATDSGKEHGDQIVSPGAGTNVLFDENTVTIAVTPIVAQEYGDAASSYGTVTATHSQSIGPRLGASVDYETAVPTGSNTDDNVGTDDENGLVITEAGSPVSSLVVGHTYTFTVSVEAVGIAGDTYTSAWMDLNGDGDFGTGTSLTTAANYVNDTSPEGFSEKATLSAGGFLTADGSHTFTFVPTAKILHDTKGTLQTRFRTSTVAGLTPLNGSYNGETEDHRITIEASDFGDLPLTYGTDYTAHAVPASGQNPRIGATRDTEAFATVNVGATGDGADEDGVTHDLAVGRLSTITVNVQNLTPTTGTAVVQLFIDDNTADGSFLTGGDTVFTPVTVTANAGGNASATFTYTPAATGTLNVRARVSNAGGLLAQGSSAASNQALDGEMEDHQLVILSSDYSDAPTGIPSTSFAYGSASHTVGGPILGTSVDADPAATAAVWQSDVAASAAFDNFDDGVVFPGTHLAGTAENVTVNLTNASASTRLDVFADLNADGDFADAGETIFSQSVGAVSSVVVPFTPTAAMHRIPANAMLRFRVSNSVSALAATGTATTGEVEDYKIVVADSFDFGDLPDGTAGSTNYSAILGASHDVAGVLPGSFPGVTLGTRIDAEPAAQASAAATGDDLTDDLPASVPNADDEDGVTWSSAVAGANLTVTMNVRNLPNGHVARVNGWIDWNRDGAFNSTVYDAVTTPSGELVLDDTASADGTFTFTVTPSVAQAIATSGVLYARFRVSSASGTAPATMDTTSNYANGELEDYRIDLTAIDFGDLLGSTTDAYDTINTTHGRPTSGSNPRFGATADTEATIIPRITADDDGADEDGVTLSSALGVGIQSTVTVNVQNVNGTTILSGWFDLNNDGDFADSGEKVLNQNISGNGDRTFVFTPTSTHARFADGIAARFRISTDANSANPTGAALNGEIEDYRFIVQTDGGDAWPVSGSGVFPDGYATSSTGHTAIGPRLGTNRDYDLATTQTVTPPSVTFGSTPTTFLTVTNGVGGLFTGMTVAGTNVPSGARVTAINTSTNVVTISANTTGASSGSYVFTGSGFGGQSTTLAADYDDARVPVINGPLATVTAGEGAAANVTGTPDDEDGLTLPLLTIGSGSVGTIGVQNVGAAGATVKAWADLNGDGDFGDSGEEIVNTTVSTLGSSNVTFNLTPTLALAQNPYLRIRIAEGTSTTLNATGYVGSGEMEDHRLQINADLGDGPVSYGLVGHGLVGTTLGATRDQDSNTTFSDAADGDDTTGATPDDETAISAISNAGPTPTQLTAGIPNTVTVNVANVPGIGAKVFAWVDLDANGSFSSGEQLAPKPVGPTTTSVTFVFTPQFSTLYRNTEGTAFMRLRVVDGSTTTSLTPNGYAATGEVEDHRLVMAAAKDFGDGVATLAAVSAPKATAPTAGNASHTGLGASLGVNVDAEFAERTTGAGDDAAAAATPTDPTQVDDEDGLIGTAGTNFNVYDGLTTTFTLDVQNIKAGRTALVKAWIDLDGDGAFTSTGEDVLETERVANGTFTFVVRPTTTQRNGFTGASILRVRVEDYATGSTAPTLNSTGDRPRGEVEDHLVYVKPAPEVLVSINDNGTPSNLLDDVLEVKDNVAGGADNDLNFVMVTESGTQKLQITSNVVGSAIFVTNQPGATGSGTSVVKIPLSQITKKVFVNTLAGADKVTLDTSGGDFITPAGWNVQMGAGTDTLDVVGSNTVNTWTFSNPSGSTANAGTLALGSHGTTTIGGIDIADGGDGNDTFKVTSASATGLTFNGDLGTDTVETLRDANFTLTNVQLQVVGTSTQTFTLGGDIENAKLTGGIGTNTFNLSGWDGATARTATLTTGGGNDVLVKDSTGLDDDDFTLNTTTLTVKEGATTRMTASLAGGFKNAVLTTDGGANSTFDVSDWYQAATLNGSTANDILKITRNFSTATLTDTRFSSGTTPQMTLSSLEDAKIVGGTGTNTLKIGNGGTAAQWNGTISFDGLAGNDTLSVNRAVTNFTAVSSQANVGTVSIDKVAGGTQTVNLIGTGAEAFSFTADDNANTFDVSGWNGTGAIFAKNGNDKIIVNKSTPASGNYVQADVTLTDTLLTTVTKTDAPGAVALTKTISLASVNDAVINGSAIVNKFNLGSGTSVWTGTATIDAGGGATGDDLVDTIAISRDANFVIGSSSVTVGGKLITLQNVDTDGASRDKLDLIGGATANTFSYNEWGGQLSINPGAGLDVLNVTETNTPATFDVDNKLVKITHGAVTHEINVNATSSFETTNITSGTGNDTVNLFGANGTYTGAGTLSLGGGSSDTVNTSTTGNQSITSSVLSHNGKNFTLSGVDALSLGGTASSNSFTVNGWTGDLSINPGEGANDNDVLTLSANLDMTLTDGTLAVGSRPVISYPVSSFETAVLNGFAGDSTFTLSGWTGKGTVNGGSGIDTLLVSKLENMELGNSLFKYGSTSIGLTGIERAAITIAGVTGTDGRFLNARAFTAGALTLTGGVGNDVIWGGSGSDTINGAAGDDVLVGNSGADTLTGGTGRDILIGGEFSSIDTLNGDDGDDILIGGKTTYDANKTAQDAFIAAWGTSSVNSYADRITLLRDTGVGNTNQFKLNKANAPNDGTIDQFFGGADDDWFFADSPGAEVLTDRVVGTETVTDTL